MELIIVMEFKLTVKIKIDIKYYKTILCNKNNQTNKKEIILRKIVKKFH